MFLKSILVLMVSALLIQASLHMGGDKMAAPDQSSYVRLEVRGTLLRKENAHYIQTSDVNFPDIKVLVRLERSEDKNRALDRYLKSLEGKTVIAHGFLDCRRVTREEGVIDLYLSGESQVKGAIND